MECAKPAVRKTTPRSKSTSEVEHCPGREQIEGRKRKIPDDSKPDNDCAKNPNPEARQDPAAKPLSPHLHEGLCRQSITDERQQQNGKRIHRPRRLQVAVQKVVDRPQRSTAGTI